MEISTTVFESILKQGKWPWKFPRQFLIQRQNGHGNFQRHLLAEVLSFQRQRLKTSMNDYREKISTLLLTPPKTFEIQFLQTAFSVHNK